MLYCILGKPVDMWAFGVILFILLGGYPPFYDDNKPALQRKIVQGTVDFDPMYWGAVSDEAKDLITSLINVDVEKRFTVDQALAHPWMDLPAPKLLTRNLTENLPHLQKFQASKKFRVGAKAIMAASAFRAGTSGTSTATAAGSDSPSNLPVPPAGGKTASPGMSSLSGKKAASVMSALAAAAKKTKLAEAETEQKVEEKTSVEAESAAASTEEPMAVEQKVEEKAPVEAESAAASVPMVEENTATDGADKNAENSTEAQQPEEEEEDNLRDSVSMSENRPSSIGAGGGGNKKRKSKKKK